MSTVNCPPPPGDYSVMIALSLSYNIPIEEMSGHHYPKLCAQSLTLTRDRNVEAGVISLACNSEVIPTIHGCVPNT
eukprot:m.113373 g.113373  ORF g.113373 m.113373 type:complete len:76 (-) comp13511_c1_seq7:1845-2072(-)